MLRRWRTCAGLTLTLGLGALAGCSETVETEHTETIAEVKQADQPDHTAMCGAELDPLTAAGGDKQHVACAGPWEYEDHQDTCVVTANDNRCPVAGYGKTTCPYSCQKFLGNHAPNQQRTYTVTGVPHSHRQRDADGSFEWVFDRYDYPLTRCTANEGSALSSVRNTLGGIDGQSGMTAAGSMNTNASTNEAEATRLCTVTVSNIPRLDWTTCTQQCDDPTKPLYSTCQANSRSFLECPSTGVKQMSTLGLTLAALQAQDPKLMSGSGASCLTGELTSDPIAKFLLLSSTYARLTSGDLAALPEAVVLAGRVASSLKLLLEMHGSTLTAAQREAALALYSRPGWPACTSDATLDPIPTTSTCGDGSASAPDPLPGDPPAPTKAELDGVLTFCRRLSLDHVPVSEVEVELPRCLQLATQLKSRGASSCDVSGYAAPFAKAVGTLTNKVNAVPVTSTPALRAGQIRARLARIEQFYAAAKPLFTNQPTAFSPYVSAATAGFWHGVYAPLRAAAAIDVNNPVVLQTFATAADSVQREVVLDAFPAPASGIAAPLTNAPLLYILGDALQPLVARLDDVGLLHDVACRFTGCTAAGPAATTTTASATWSALAHLDDGTILKLLATPKPPGLAGGWAPAILAIAENHAILEHAVQDAYGDASASPSRLATDLLRDLPAPAAGLAQVILKARQRSGAYATTGLFDSGAVDALVTGLQQSKQLAAVADVKAHIGTLATHRGDYEAHRSKAVSDALQELGTTGAANRGMTNLQLKMQQMADTASRLEGYRFNAAADALAFADFGKQFQRMLDDDTESAELKIPRPTTTLPTLQQANARYVTNGARTVAANAVTFGEGGPWMLAAGAGDVLNIDVSGSWSPACALMSTPPWQGQIDAASVRVGPEGFSVQKQGSSYSVDSASASQEGSLRKSLSVSVRACLALKAKLGTPVVGAEISLTTEACLAEEISKSVTESHTTTDTQGTEMRQATTLAMGLRLPNTPFPSLPAGSLLLLGVTPGSGGVTPESLQTIRVVQAPRVTIPVGAALDFYLVVNDVGACGSSLSVGGGGLTVSISQLQPAGVRGAALGRAMATTVTKLRERAASLAMQGELLPEDGTALRSQALENLRTACACEPTSYPAHYLGFYNAWIDSEILRLQRQVAIRKEMFALQQIGTEIKGYTDDINIATSQGRLLELLPTWALQNLDGEKLRADISQIAQDLDYEVYPAARLRYPSALAAIRGNAAIQNQLHDLLNNATTKSLDELASQLELVAGSITTALDNAVRLAPEANQTTMRAGLSFVRPDLYRRDASGVSTADDSSLSGYTPVSEARSRAVWSAASAGTVAQLVITPSDLFGHGLTQIPCVVATPVINWTGVFLGGVDEAAATPFNNRPLNAVVEADELGLYASVDGLFPYRMRNPDLRTGPIKIAAGPWINASTAFTTAPHALAGMSPFTTMRIDFSLVQATPEKPLNQASEILLIFELDAAGAAAGPRGVVSCGGPL